MLSIFENNDSGEVLGYFAEVLLPLPLKGTFTYRIPKAFVQEAAMGKRVAVPFGNRNTYTGIIVEIHQTPPKNYTAKPLLDIIDTLPSINSIQIQLFAQLAKYYMCFEGELLNIALPAGLKINSESHFGVTEEPIPEGITDQELDLWQIINKKEHISFSDLSKECDIKYIHKTLKSLIEKNLIVAEEEIKQKYKPKTQKKLRIASPYLDPGVINKLLEQFKSKPAQLNILLFYLSKIQIFLNPADNIQGISKSEISHLSASAMSQLIKSGILEEFQEEIFRLGHSEEIMGLPSLSSIQTKAYEEIKTSFEKANTTLLYGITGSGKTEIYINLIDKYLQNESQVLYLLPEIALTTQIVERLKKCFGDKLGVYHSKFSENERVEVWNGLQSGRFQVIIGARSAMFLPFDNLGLIIIDEEHETSYKQQDPAPRYHAREGALFLARLHHCKTLLGSATPSVESYWLALQGKYGLVKLTERYGGAGLPSIHFAKIDQPLKKESATPLTDSLLVNIRDRIAKKEQSILFLNRRGFSPIVSCNNCGWIPTCPRCNVSLTFHQYKNKLSCHYCGYSQNNTGTCFACQSTQIKTLGIGTEKIEDELKLHFPDIRIKRMDLETTRTKYAYQEIIASFAKGEIDVLVGTQMVSKGLDFDNVTLVGVIDVDQMMNFPDFRAHERTFHLVTQVSGRAGRRSKQGEVIIQSHNLHQRFLKHLSHQDYEKYYEEEIEERRHFNYPPFSRLIKITTKHKDKDTCLETAQILGDELRVAIGHTRIKGPTPPYIDKIRDYYLQEIIIKCEREQVDIAKVKEIVSKEVFEVLKLKKSSLIAIDVDFT